MITYVTQVRVRYADTDQMKMVYYGKFFEYFEQGRSDLLRDMGLPYPQIEEMGFYLPVIEAHANYKRSARYDDALLITTMLREVPVARVRLDYEVRKEGETEVMAVGHTIHSFINASSGKPTRAPAQFLERIEEKMNAKTK
ncbi:MAG: acyl-CoA thioesterase [Bacteroidota bacterium]